jgi:hypothetical protein
MARPLRLGLSVLMVFAALTALSSSPVSGQSAVGATGAPPWGRVSGIDLLTRYTPIADYGPEFQRIRADGANTVSLDVWQLIPSVSSSKIVPVPKETDTDGDLLAAAQKARQAGLRVTLTPKIEFGPRGAYNGWRGYYDPPDPQAFFASYQSMIDHYATLAQQAGMSMLVIGSEMNHADQYVSNWRRIISDARRHFAGSIGYEANWDEILQFAFGDAVDVILLSAYFPTSNEERPTLQQLKAGWHSYQFPGQTQTQDAFSTVAGLASRWHKPIVFGEGGYTATTYPAQEPWWNRPNPTVEPELQYLAYQALLDTFVGQPWWGGVLWWAWNDDPSQRSPEGKPAESLIGAACVAVPAGSRTGAAPGSTQPVSDTSPCQRGPVDPQRAPVDWGSTAAATSMHRVVTGTALGSLVLAILATVLLRGWLQGRRRRAQATRPAMD